MNYSKRECVFLTWAEVEKETTDFMKLVFKRRINCSVKPDDFDYWAIRFENKRLPVKDLYALFDYLHATACEREESEPIDGEHSVSSIGMSLAIRILEKQLRITWETFHLTDDGIWLINCREQTANG